MKSKLNIGMALARNFDKVTLEMVDEQIEYENDEELIQGIRKRFTIIKLEVDKQFMDIKKQKEAEGNV